MKEIRFFYIATVVAVSILMTGCNEQKLDVHTVDYYKAHPQEIDHALAACGVTGKMTEDCSNADRARMLSMTDSSSAVELK